MEAVMKAATFAKDWKLTREEARALADDEYLSVLMEHEGSKYEVARWSRFVERYDREKVELYLPVPTGTFGERLADQLDHTARTGIGKIVLYRDVPRYVLDPGGRWRSHQAACFGVTPSRYLEAVRGVRTVQRMLDRQQKALRKHLITADARAEAAEEALEEMRIDFGVQEMEVRRLRADVRRVGAE